MPKLKTRNVKKPALRLVWAEAGSLTAHPKNWKRHPPEQLRALDDLIHDPEIGWVKAVVYNERTGHLLDGHGRLKITKPDEIIPVWVGSWRKELEPKILLTLDPVASLAAPDSKKLQTLMEEYPLSDEVLEPLNDNLLDRLEEMEAINGSGKALRSRGGGGGDGGGDGIEEQFKIVIDCRNENHQKQLSRRFEKEGLKFNLLVA